MELLNKLCDFCACSGNEKQLLSFISEYVKPYADEIFTDNLGNLYVRINRGSKKFMISSSVDEVGFFTTISDENNIKVAKIGNIEVKNIKDTLVTFENGKSGLVLGEISEKTEDYSVKVFSDKEGDFTGLTAAFTNNFNLYDDYVVSKGLSARIGAYVLLKLIGKELNGYDFYFVFSVKKHIGMKGAKVIGNNVKPDFAVVLDCYKGENIPSVLLKDKSYIADDSLGKLLVECGFKGVVDKEYQSEGNAVQTSFTGIPTVVCGLGIENIYSRNEICKVKTIHELTNNIINFIKKENV